MPSCCFDDDGDDGDDDGDDGGGGAETSEGGFRWSQERRAEKGSGGPGCRYTRWFPSDRRLSKQPLPASVRPSSHPIEVEEFGIGVRRNAGVGEHGTKGVHLTLFSFHTSSV